MSINSINGNGLPIVLVDQNDRTRRPRERSFAEWIKTLEPSLNETRAIYKAKYGIDMSDLEGWQYLAWSMDNAIARLLWTVDDDPQALLIMASSSFDSRERYRGFRDGRFPSPQGQRYESPQEFERGLQGASAPPSEHGYGTYL